MKTKRKSLVLIAAAITALLVVAVSCKKDKDDIDLPPIGGYDNSDDIASDNLVAKFSFEDNINDQQDNVLGGSSTNTTYETGVKGKAWKGSASGITIFDTPGSRLAGLQSFTVAFWINTSVHTDGAEGVFMLDCSSNWIGNLFLLQESGTEGIDSIRFKFKFDNWDASSWKEQWIDFTGEYRFKGLTDTWVHLAFTYDGSSSKFYVYQDGVKRELSADYSDRWESDPGAGGAPLGNASFKDVNNFIFGAYQNMIGGNPDAWMKYYDGMLDEFRIYDKALVDSDVDALYQLEKDGR